MDKVDRQDSAGHHTRLLSCIGGPVEDLGAKEGVRWSLQNACLPLPKSQNLKERPVEQAPLANGRGKMERNPTGSREKYPGNK